MASFVLEYDPAGDVQLILEGKFGDRFDIGPLGVSMGKVQLRTSSEKLISSSRYFKAMFERSRFSEAMELEEHGSIEIPLSEPEDDPTAMMIVLGILHNDQFFLLRDMDLWLLDRLATLVDKYEWHALVTPRARMSFDSLVQSKGLPHRFDQDLLKWLWISWVFGIKDHFKTLSRVAQQDACQPINLEDRNIRLPTSVLRINDQRKLAFQKVRWLLESNKNAARGSTFYDLNKESEETFMVRCMQLGFLMLQGEKLGVEAGGDPGISVRMLQSRATSMFDPMGWNMKLVTRHYSSQPAVPVDYKGAVSKCIENLKMDEWGLNYDDFQPPQVNQHSTGLQAPPKVDNSTSDVTSKQQTGQDAT